MSIIINKPLTPPNVSRETFFPYYEELCQWGASLSLMNDLSSFDYFYDRHIFDAIQMIPHCHKKKILDLGSGAGVPAIPLSICGEDVTLVESNKKKSIFLNHCIAKFSLSANVVCKRIEVIDIQNYEVITARALASLKDLLLYCRNVSRETKCIFIKGEKLFDEIDEAQKEWLFHFEIYRTINEQGYIIIISDIEKR